MLGYSVRGAQNYSQFQYQKGDWLVFVSETQGLPREILQLCDTTLNIPIDSQKVRSLNLSVSVAIGLFEARRQIYYT